MSNNILKSTPHIAYRYEVGDARKDHTHDVLAMHLDESTSSATQVCLWINEDVAVSQNIPHCSRAFLKSAHSTWPLLLKQRQFCLLHDVPCVKLSYEIYCTALERSRAYKNFISTYLKITTFLKNCFGDLFFERPFDWEKIAKNTTYSCERYDQNGVLNIYDVTQGSVKFVEKLEHLELLKCVEYPPHDVHVTYDLLWHEGCEYTTELRTSFASYYCPQLLKDIQNPQDIFKDFQVHSNRVAMWDVKDEEHSAPLKYVQWCCVLGKAQINQHKVRFRKLFNTEHATPSLPVKNIHIECKLNECVGGRFVGHIRESKDYGPDMPFLSVGVAQTFQCDDVGIKDGEYYVCTTAHEAHSFIEHMWHKSTPVVYNPLCGEFVDSTVQHILYTATINAFKESIIKRIYLSDDHRQTLHMQIGDYFSWNNLSGYITRIETDLQGSNIKRKIIIDIHDNFSKHFSFSALTSAYVYEHQSNSGAAECTVDNGADKQKIILDQAIDPQNVEASYALEDLATTMRIVIQKAPKKIDLHIDLNEERDL